MARWRTVAAYPTRRDRPASAGLAAMALAAALVTGCGADEPSEDERAAPGSGSAAPSSPSATPTSSPSPTVEPATGPLLRMRDATVRLPEGWKPDPTNTPEILVAVRDGSRGDDGFGIVVLPLGDQRFGRQFRSLARTHPGVRFERGPDTEVGGFPAMYASGRDTRDPGQWEIVLSMFDGDHGYTLSFSLHQRSRAAREALVDSVLASWEWRV